MLGEDSPVKINVRVQMNLRTPEVIRQVEQAVHDSLRETVVAITRDAKDFSPFLTGNNRRSIDFDVQQLSGRVFSTSGYGGWLEIGTAQMTPRRYFRTAYELNIDKFPAGIKARLS